LLNYLTYREHRPPRDLSPWVTTYWRIAGVIPQGTDVQHRVLPDGCADLLFDFQAARDSRGQQGILVGPMLAAQSFRLCGSIDVVGVRFRPGGATQFLGIPMQHIRDDAVPLSELPTSCRYNVSQLADLADSSSLFARLTGDLRRRLPELQTSDLVVREALTQMTIPRGDRSPSILSVARSLGVCERALERRFTVQVGLTPVQYRRLARFRAVLRRYASGHTNWAEIAASTGFSDQPHLARDFRAWAGISPTEWAFSQTGDVGFVQDGAVTII
jgi:AraC-like DNA-binding protein